MQPSSLYQSSASKVKVDRSWSSVLGYLSVFRPAQCSNLPIWSSFCAPSPASEHPPPNCHCNESLDMCHVQDIGPHSPISNHLWMRHHVKRCLWYKASFDVWYKGILMSCTSPMSQCPLNSFGKSLGKSWEWCSDFVSVDLFVSSRLAMSNAYDTVMAMPCLVFHHLSHKILIICQSTFSVHPATPNLQIGILKSIASRASSQPGSQALSSAWGQQVARAMAFPNRSPLQWCSHFRIKHWQLLVNDTTSDTANTNKIVQRVQSWALRKSAVNKW